MDLFAKIMGGISILLLCCTVICGLWIHSNPQEDHRFHFKLSLAAVLVSLGTIILFMFR